ncbi:transposase [Streptomyces griseoflavus]|uniref:transposase n=1 Tax=Streptomyces griseoflavus TaxID=35619 RepID=UPI0038267204
MSSSAVFGDAEVCDRSHDGRRPEQLNTEASFAALCGVGPIEYSSGRSSTCRLNHGGDRRPTPPCTASSLPACATTRAPIRTAKAAPRRARHRRGLPSWSTAGARTRQRRDHPGRTACMRTAVPFQ